MTQSSTSRKKFYVSVIALIFLMALFGIFYLVMQGKIRIVGDGGAEKVICGDRGENHEQVQCWISGIKEIIQSKGMHAAFAAMSDRFMNEPSFKRSCNAILHEVGHWAYHETARGNIPFSVPPHITLCAHAFDRAFVHELVAMTGDFSKAKEFCADPHIAPESPHSTASCYHGVGHGALSFYSSKMIGEKSEKVVERALEECTKISYTSSQLGNWCAGGVFAEVVRSYQANKHGWSVNPKDPFSFCQGQSDSLMRSNCYATAHPLLLWLTHDDFPKAASFVENIADDTDAIGAMRNLGSSVTKRNIRNNVSMANYAGDALVCRGLQERLHIPCIEGLAKEFLTHGPPLAPVDAVAFCELSVLMQQEKDSCLKFIVSQLPEWTSEDETRQICSLLKDRCKINLEVQI